MNGSLILGVRLREARIAAGLTIRDAAQLAGCSNPYVSQLETGYASNPSAFILHKLCRAYEIDFGKLMDEINPPALKYLR